MILRCNPIAFGHWGLSLVTSQLHDSNQLVLIEAISVLDEALEDRRLVNLFHKQWSTFAKIKSSNHFLADIYHMAAARICSIPFHQIPER